jgi:CRP-like cAMP-binding protein
MSATRECGTRIVVKRGEAIFSEGDAAAYLYRLASGSVRLLHVSEDGERQICDFFLPGDLIGVSNGESYSFAAEAIQDCSLIRYARNLLPAIMKQDATLAYELQQLTATGLHSAYEHMVTLCRRSARDRIVWFLLAMAKRSANDNWVNLPMSHVDEGGGLARRERALPAG